MLFDRGLQYGVYIIEYIIRASLAAEQFHVMCFAIEFRVHGRKVGQGQLTFAMSTLEAMLVQNRTVHTKFFEMENGFFTGLAFFASAHASSHPHPRLFFGLHLRRLGRALSLAHVLPSPSLYASCLAGNTSDARLGHREQSFPKAEEHAGPRLFVPSGIGSPTEDTRRPTNQARITKEIYLKQAMAFQKDFIRLLPSDHNPKRDL